MFTSNLSFSKALMAERTRRAPRRSATQRIFWLAGGRPGPRQTTGQGR